MRSNASDIQNLKESNVKLQCEIKEMQETMQKYKEKSMSRKVQIKELQKQVDPLKAYTAKDVEGLKDQYEGTICKLEDRIKMQGIKGIECDQTMSSLRVENEHMKSTIEETSFMNSKIYLRPNTANSDNKTLSPHQDMRFEDMINKETYLTQLSEIDKIIKNI